MEHVGGERHMCALCHIDLEEDFGMPATSLEVSMKRLLSDRLQELGHASMRFVHVWDIIERCVGTLCLRSCAEFATSDRLVVSHACTPAFAGGTDSLAASDRLVVSHACTPAFAGCTDQVSLLNFMILDKPRVL